MPLSPSSLSSISMFPLNRHPFPSPSWAFHQRVPPEFPDIGPLESLLSPVLLLAPSTPGLRARYLRVLGVVMHNLYMSDMYTRLHGTTIRVAVYRGHTPIPSGLDRSLRVSKPVQNRILDALQSCGLVYMKRGSFRVLENGSKACRPSTYWPTETLSAALRSSPLRHLRQFDQDTPERALVSLRDRSDKVELDIREGLDEAGLESLSRQESLLLGYNALLACTGYEVVVPGHLLLSSESLRLAVGQALSNEKPDAFWPDGPGEPCRLSFPPRSLTFRRIFTGDLNHGGRMYAGVQGLSHLLRPFTKLGGEPVVDLDYTGAHVRLLYKKVGQEPPADLYPLDLSRFSPLQLAKFREAELAGRITPRGIAKKALLTAVNAKNLDSAVGSLRRAMAEEWYIYLKADRDGETTPIEAIFKDLAAAHAPIASYFYSDVGIECQFEESAIMMRVVTECTGRGIPVIAMHDGVMAPASKVDEVRRIMLGAWPGGREVKGLVKVKELGGPAGAYGAPLEAVGVAGQDMVVRVGQVETVLGTGNGQACAPAGA